MHRLRAALGTTLAVLALATPATADPAKVAPAPALAWERVLDIAHRGASADAPENTLAAFELAGRMGADVNELDVQETKDHRLVIVHDTTLKRTTNVEKVFPKLKPWRVKDLTLKQIKRLDAGSWFGRRFKGERVPTLTEALRTNRAAGTGVLLELKRADLYPGIVDRVITTVKADPYWRNTDRLIVQSFSWRFLKPVHQKLPSAGTAALGRPDQPQMFGLRWFTDVVHPQYHSITPDYVRDARAQWLDVFAYTVNDETQMRRLVEMGVDGITTNRPDVLRRVLEG
ncbi:hydrolase [Actinocorallia lasiicapitis]